MATLDRLSKVVETGEHKEEIEAMDGVEVVSGVEVVVKAEEVLLEERRLSVHKSGREAVWVGGK